VSDVVASGLIVDLDGEERLVGARCERCATHAFPLQATCPRCGAPMSAVALAAAGTLWSWTVQRLEPKPPYRGPHPFEPFAVGYVDLGVVRVESRLEGKPLSEWQIGDPVRLAAGPANEAGEIWSYRFVSGAGRGPE